jgi:signal peptidase II
LFKGYNWLFTLLSFIVLVYFLYYYKIHKKYYLQIAVICAGIIGNLIDRLVFGYVIDFFSVWVFPIFNVADSAISIGVLWLVFVMMRDGD